MSKPMTFSKPASLRRFHHADDAAGRAGQQRILALEHVGGGQAARRHHEHQAGRGDWLISPLVGEITVGAIPSSSPTRPT